MTILIPAPEYVRVALGHSDLRIPVSQGPEKLRHLPLEALHLIGLVVGLGPDVPVHELLVFRLVHEPALVEVRLAIAPRAGVVEVRSLGGLAGAPWALITWRGT